MMAHHWSTSDPALDHQWPNDGARHPHNSPVLGHQWATRWSIMKEGLYMPLQCCLSFMLSISYTTSVPLSKKKTISPRPLLLKSFVPLSRLINLTKNAKLFLTEHTSISLTLFYKQTQVLSLFADKQCFPPTA